MANKITFNIFRTCSVLNTDQIHLHVLWKNVVGNVYAIYDFYNKEILKHELETEQLTKNLP